MFGRTLILKTSEFPPIKKLVRHSFLFRPLVKRFIAGDTLEEAMTAAEDLVERGYKVTLDYLGENTQSEEEAIQAKNTYTSMLERIAKSPSATGADHQAPYNGEMHRIESHNISIKLTQCGLDQGTEFAEKNFREVLEVAQKHNNFVRVDMESSEYTSRTIEMIQRVWPDFKNTGTVLQTYLYRTPQDVETIIDLGARVRLVKGAYLEPHTVAFKDKVKVDDAYITLGKRLLHAGNYPAIATQDERIIKELNEYVEAQNIDKAGFEYQMLYGVRRDLQESLLKEGYNVRIYIPFGDSWYPYFTRRLAERPANSLFILKSLFKG